MRFIDVAIVATAGLMLKGELAVHCFCFAEKPTALLMLSASHQPLCLKDQVSDLATPLR